MAPGTSLVAVALAALAACGSDTAPPDARPGDPTLAAIRSEIFNTTCALASCHAPPTLAAKLNLRDTGLCRAMVTHTSCLFANRLLVVPGKPEASFLLDKLRGATLAGEPDPACATSNEQMPLGQPPLSAGQIAQIEQWIRDGASCGDEPPTDAGPSDAPSDGPDESLADVASITAPATTLEVGARIQVTVTLTHGAPPAGQTLILEAEDVAILAVPASVHLAHGVSATTFDVLGKQPAATTYVTASSGTTAKSLTLTVVSATLAGERAPTGPLAR